MCATGPAPLAKRIAQRQAPRVGAHTRIRLRLVRPQEGIESGLHVLQPQAQPGLEQALADGSFDRLFFAHYGDALQRARLSERQLIELDNPLLPPDTPLQRAELWLSREQLLKH